MKLLRLAAINLLVFIGLVGACCIGIELWARTQPRNVFVEFDPVLGFRLKPNAEGVYRGLSALSPHPDIRTVVRVNSLGLRGPEVTVQKPRGTRRVLVLGDSMVQAFEVPYEETFYALLQRIAQERSSNPIQVIPMGVMGYGTAQELLWLRERGKTFQPDVVVLVLSLVNDLTDNSRALSSSGGRPYFELDGPALKLVAVPNSINRYKYWAAEHIRSFHLYRDIGSRISLVRSALNRLSLDNSPRSAGNAQPAGPDPRVSEAFRLTFALVRDMRRTAEDAGSQFLLAYYGKYPTGLAQDAQSLIADFCARDAFECVNLNPYVARDEQRNVVANDGHWSVAGHRVVADVLWEHWGHYFVPPPGSDTKPARFNR